MAWRRANSLGRSTNEAVTNLTGRVDDQTGQVAARAAQVIAVAVRILRIPTAALLWVPVPFIALTLLLGLNAQGGARVIIVIVALAMAAVSVAFGVRRHKIINAVDDPDKLATELGIMISLSDKVNETRGTLAQLAGGDGWRVFSRLQGLWRGASMTGKWINGIADLPRARYFGPPKIGTTITIVVAALWLVPISIVAALFAAIGSIASTF